MVYSRRKRTSSSRLLRPLFLVIALLLIATTHLAQVATAFSCNQQTISTPSTIHVDLTAESFIAIDCTFKGITGGITISGTSDASDLLTGSVVAPPPDAKPVGINKIVFERCTFEKPSGGGGRGGGDIDLLLRISSLLFGGTNNDVISIVDSDLSPLILHVIGASFSGTGTRIHVSGSKLGKITLEGSVVTAGGILDIEHSIIDTKLLPAKHHAAIAFKDTVFSGVGTQFRVTKSSRIAVTNPNPSHALTAIVIFTGVVSATLYDGSRVYHDVQGSCGALCNGSSWIFEDSFIGGFRQVQNGNEQDQAITTTVTVGGLNCNGKRCTRYYRSYVGRGAMVLMHNMTFRGAAILTGFQSSDQPIAAAPTSSPPLLMISGVNTFLDTENAKGEVDLLLRGPRSLIKEPDLDTLSKNAYDGDKAALAHLLSLVLLDGASLNFPDGGSIDIWKTVVVSVMKAVNTSFLEQIKKGHNKPQQRQSLLLTNGGNATIFVRNGNVRLEHVHLANGANLHVAQVVSSTNPTTMFSTRVDKVWISDRPFSSKYYAARQHVWSAGDDSPPFVRQIAENGDAGSSSPLPPHSLPPYSSGLYFFTNATHKITVSNAVVIGGRHTQLSRQAALHFTNIGTHELHVDHGEKFELVVDGEEEEEYDVPSKLSSANVAATYMINAGKEEAQDVTTHPLAMAPPNSILKHRLFSAVIEHLFATGDAQRLCATTMQKEVPLNATEVNGDTFLLSIRQTFEMVLGCDDDDDVIKDDTDAEAPPGLGVLPGNPRPHILFSSFFAAGVALQGINLYHQGHFQLKHWFFLGTYSGTDTICGAQLPFRTDGLHVNRIHDRSSFMLENVALHHVVGKKKAYIALPFKTTQRSLVRFYRVGSLNATGVGTSYNETNDKTNVNTLAQQGFVYGNARIDCGVGRDALQEVSGGSVVEFDEIHLYAYTLPVYLTTIVFSPQIFVNSFLTIQRTTTHASQNGLLFQPVAEFYKRSGSDMRTFWYRNEPYQNATVTITNGCHFHGIYGAVSNYLIYTQKDGPYKNTYILKTKFGNDSVINLGGEVPVTPWSSSSFSTKIGVDRGTSKSSRTSFIEGNLYLFVTETSTLNIFGERPEADQRMFRDIATMVSSTSSSLTEGDVTQALFRATQTVNSVYFATENHVLIGPDLEEVITAPDRPNTSPPENGVPSQAVVRIHGALRHDVVKASLVAKKNNKGRLVPPNFEHSPEDLRVRHTHRLHLYNVHVVGTADTNGASSPSVIVSNCQYAHVSGVCSGDVSSSNGTTTTSLGFHAQRRCAAVQDVLRQKKNENEASFTGLPPLSIRVDHRSTNRSRITAMMALDRVVYEAGLDGNLSAYGRSPFLVGGFALVPPKPWSAPYFAISKFSLRDSFVGSGGHIRLEVPAIGRSALLERTVVNGPNAVLTYDGETSLFLRTSSEPLKTAPGSSSLPSASSPVTEQEMIESGTPIVWSSRKADLSLTGPFEVSAGGSVRLENLLVATVELGAQEPPPRSSSTTSMTKHVFISGHKSRVEILQSTAIGDFPSFTLASSLRVFENGIVRFENATASMEVARGRLYNKPFLRDVFWTSREKDSGANNTSSPPIKKNSAQDHKVPWTLNPFFLDHPLTSSASATKYLGLRVDDDSVFDGANATLSLVGVGFNLVQFRVTKINNGAKVSFLNSALSGYTNQAFQLIGVRDRYVNITFCVTNTLIQSELNLAILFTATSQAAVKQGVYFYEDRIFEDSRLLFVRCRIARIPSTASTGVGLRLAVLNYQISASGTETHRRFAYFTTSSTIVFNDTTIQGKVRLGTDPKPPFSIASKGKSAVNVVVSALKMEGQQAAFSVVRIAGTQHAGAVPPNVFACEVYLLDDVDTTAKVNSLLQRRHPALVFEAGGSTLDLGECRVHVAGSQASLAMRGMVKSSSPPFVGTHTTLAKKLLIKRNQMLTIVADYRVDKEIRAAQEAGGNSFPFNQMFLRHLHATEGNGTVRVLFTSLEELGGEFDAEVLATNGALVPGQIGLLMLSEAPLLANNARFELTINNNTVHNNPTKVRNLVMIDDLLLENGSSLLVNSPQREENEKEETSATPIFHLYRLRFDRSTVRSHSQILLNKLHLHEALAVGIGYGSQAVQLPTRGESKQRGVFVKDGSLMALYNSPHVHMIYMYHSRFDVHSAFDIRNTTTFGVTLRTTRFIEGSRFTVANNSVIDPFWLNEKLNSYVAEWMKMLHPYAIFCLATYFDTRSMLVVDGSTLLSKGSKSMLVLTSSWTSVKYSETYEPIFHNFSGLVLQNEAKLVLRAVKNVNIIKMSHQISVSKNTWANGYFAANSFVLMRNGASLLLDIPDDSTVPKIGMSVSKIIFGASTEESADGKVAEVLEGQNKLLLDDSVRFGSHQMQFKMEGYQQESTESMNIVPNSESQIAVSNATLVDAEQVVISTNAPAPTIMKVLTSANEKKAAIDRGIELVNTIETSLALAHKKLPMTTTTTTVDRIDNSGSQTYDEEGMAMMTKSGFSLSGGASGFCAVFVDDEEAAFIKSATQSSTRTVAVVDRTARLLTSTPDGPTTHSRSNSIAPHPTKSLTVSTTVKSPPSTTTSTPDKPSPTPVPTTAPPVNTSTPQTRDPTTPSPPPPPQKQSSSVVLETIAGDGSEAVAASGTVAAVATGAVSPTAASQAVRIGAALRTINCAFSEDESLDPGYLEHPLQMSVGSDENSPLRLLAGSALMTAIVFVALPSCLMFVARHWYIAKVKRVEGITARSGFAGVESEELLDGQTTNEEEDDEEMVDVVTSSSSKSSSTSSSAKTVASSFQQSAIIEAELKVPKKVVGAAGTVTCICQLYFLPTAIGSAVTIITHSGATSSSSSSSSSSAAPQFVAIGIAILLICGMSLFSTFLFICSKKRFGAVGSWSRSESREQRTSTSSSSSSEDEDDETPKNKRSRDGNGSDGKKLEFTNKPQHIGFIETFFAFFDATRDEKRLITRLYLFEDLMTANLLAIIAGIRPSKQEHCKTLAGAIVLVSLAHFAYLTIIRPYRTKLDKSFTIFFSANQVLLGVLVMYVTIKSESEKEHTNQDASSTSTAMDIIGVAVFVQMISFFGETLIQFYWAYYTSHRARIRDLSRRAVTDDGDHDDHEGEEQKSNDDSPKPKRTSGGDGLLSVPLLPNDDDNEDGGAEGTTTTTRKSGRNANPLAQ